jgi:predicted DCC family thiol-disulfide oxidoreductase YuxK
MSGWTGGQYSVWRVALALALVALFATAPPFLGQAAPLARGLALAAAVALGLGWLGALAAVLLVPLVVAASQGPILGASLAGWLGAWLLAMHATTPQAPFGSWKALGRSDPGGGWRLPRWFHDAHWVLLGGLYAWRGWSSLLSPDRRTDVFGWLSFGVELAVLPLAFERSLRPWAWSAAVLLELARPFLGGGVAPWSLALLLALAFDPRWVPPAERPRPARLFYDGTCGLCHGFVRFLLAEDSRGELRFAPLGGRAFERSVAPEERAGLPDSNVVRTGAGELLVRSDAVAVLLASLGGLWRVLAVLLLLLPRRWRDAGYDLVARHRRSLVAPPAAACPMVPAALAVRFDA